MRRIFRALSLVAMLLAAGLHWTLAAAAITSTLQQVAPLAATYPSASFTLSGTGDVTGSATFVDVQIPPSPAPNTSTSGCEASDFAGFTPGRIAVIQRGTCTFEVKVLNAQAAGASAVVIFNEGQPGRTDVLGGSLGAPGITIPVVGTSFAVAQELFSLRFSGLILRVAVADDTARCAVPPAIGTPLPGRNVVVASPAVTTVGTEGPDVIYGTSGPDRIAGLGGDDIVFGFGGADQISGGDGADVLCGGADNDLVSGGLGSDVVSGDAGNDDLAGGEGGDTLVDVEGANRLVGGDGPDVCSVPGNQLQTCETNT